MGYILFFIFIDERERNIDLLFMCSLVVSCVCPDQGLNLQPWPIERMLYLTELPTRAKVEYISNLNLTTTKKLTQKCSAM